jgi:hypothetical protein
LFDRGRLLRQSKQLLLLKPASKPAPVSKFMAVLPHLTNNRSPALKKAANPVRKSHKIQRLLVHILHLNPNNKPTEIKLRTWNDAGIYSGGKFWIGLEGENILLRKFTHPHA